MTTPLLTSGAYALSVSDLGGGQSRYGALALTRWSGDVTTDNDGFFLYVRDVESGHLWSAGLQPTLARPTRYAIRRSPRHVEIVREDNGIELQTVIALTSDGCAELRRYTLVNHGHTNRRLELTTYAEVVLNTPAGDAGHPAFSKLFVQTEYDAERDALFARRRQRSPDDPTLWLVHAFVSHDALGTAPVEEYETDRMRFVGRGRTLAAPRALSSDTSLSQTTGNVLDPVIAMRRVVEVTPGARVTVTALLGAGADRTAVERIVARFADSAAIDVAMGQAATADALIDVELPSLVDAATDPYRRARIADSPPGLEADDNETEALTSENGFGGFSADGTEYVVRIHGSDAGPVRPPLPWVNVIANGDVGFLVSESGASNTWSANSREHRLTPWLNDPVSDPHGEA
ncbi:MAG: glycosyl transferase, partial [Gemmatimonadaceae bacterium]